MPVIPNMDRNQIHMLCFEELVSEESMVRVIDAFCSTYKPQDLGFEVKGLSQEGRPAFSADTLIRIYIYGYLNKLRSSRELERACRLNIELWWLTGYQVPCYKTIADFRKNNRLGFSNLFKHFRGFCKQLELYGKDTVAIDGSKFRAQNSKKNNFNQKKIEQHLQYIESQNEHYLKELDKADAAVSKMDRKEIEDKLESLAARKEKYESLDKELKASGELQISTTDPDARALPLHMNIVEVGYNVQTAVDDKHNLIVNYEVTNCKDNDTLSSMAIEAKSALDLGPDEILTALADKGYYTGEQLEKCHQNNVDTLVSPKKNGNSKKDARFQKNKFEYAIEADVYICPEGKALKTNGNYYSQKGRRKVSRFKRYTLKHSTCKQCPFAKQCVGGRLNKGHGKVIQRYEFEDAMDHNNEQMALRKNEYKRRQAIVEHPFGTIKRQWSFTHTLLKTKEKVETEFSIIFLCYNLRRVMSILGQKGLKKALNHIFLHILTCWRSMSGVSDKYLYELVTIRGGCQRQIKYSL